MRLEGSRCPVPASEGLRLRVGTQLGTLRADCGGLELRATSSRLSWRSVLARGRAASEFGFGVWLAAYMDWWLRCEALRPSECNAPPFSGLCDPGT
eukprot:2695849-Pyramimonas_sp.AAC.1